eukprot:15131899-Alexandrium_andersonii.AAC.1
MAKRLGAPSACAKTGSARVLWRRCCGTRGVGGELQARAGGHSQLGSTPLPNWATSKSRAEA